MPDIADDRWTCPTCRKTSFFNDPRPWLRDVRRRKAQEKHAKNHRMEVPA